MRLAASSELKQTRLAGRYELLETLGVGGVGTVYRARDEVAAREVALKLLRVVENDPNRERRAALFEREFQTLARLKHPRIIEVYEYGVAGEVPYYTMELLDGHDLQQLSPLPVREACKVLRDVASSLALLHTQRLLHRDVSPRNVRRAAGGRAKLIDFGALTSFGDATEVIGTPMCIAPEVLACSQLDQRGDLYALGALGYWAVTGRAAYPAQHLRELPDVWETAPPPPSHWNPDVPPALDTLLMSLLHLDPLARPASAAAVIERLSSIAELPVDTGAHETGESYLLSGRLVGREQDRGFLAQRIKLALEGKGSEVALVGPPGIGRSRLLREIGLDAALFALLALRADAELSAAPYAVPVSLALQLLNVAPEVARSAAAPHAGVLAQLAPELAAKLAVAPVELSAEPGQRSQELQDALLGFFGVAARQLPILVAVDNLQAADADSIAFLERLSRAARELRLLVVVAMRTASGSSLLPPALRRLQTRSGQLRLRPLDPTACEELIKSIFGELASSARVARLLYEHSGGNPRQFMELLHVLVDGGVARYLDGAWVLPLEAAIEALPDRAEALAEERLALLGETARALATALSIHRKPVSIERCVQLLPGRDERELYAALAELVSERILTMAQGSYRFEHAALRHAIAARLEPEQRRREHARAAELWLSLAGAGDSEAASAGARVEAAWHLIAAGEESDGADMLADAGDDSLQAGAPGALEDTVQAFEAALAVYTRERRPPLELARLSFRLVSLAFFVDRRVVREHGERVVLLGLRLTGLSFARWFALLLGRRWGLGIGRWLARLRFGVERTQAELQETFASFCGLVPWVIGTANLSCDMQTVSRLARLLEPFGLFRPGELGHALHAYVRGQLALGRGCEVEARRWLEQLEREFEQPQIQSQLGAARWSSLQGGIQYSLGVLDRTRFGARALERARALEELPLRVWASGADQVRMLYHAQRGESERVEHYRERVELFAARSGSTLQVEMLAPVLLLSCEVLAQDTLATRRVWEQLARRATELPALAVYAEAAHAAYLALRGEWPAAIERYSRVLPRLPPRERSGWANIRAHFADTLNWAGEHARAKALMDETLAQLEPGEERGSFRSLELERQLALAEAGLGEHARAAERLDALLAHCAAEDQPLVVGLLHKARAEVALQMRDAAELERQLEALELRFRATRNPALIAQCERLGELAVRQGVRRAPWSG